MVTLARYWWIAGAALAGLLFWRKPSGAPALPASPFQMLNQVRYWRPDLATSLANILSRYDASPHPSGTERVFELVPKGKGAKPAVLFVREAQGQGNVVTSGTNLLDVSATAGPKSIAVLLPAEFPKKAENAEGVAVLPKV